MPKVRKYILSLDGGGGFRGLTSLIILNHIVRMLVHDQGDEPVPSPCEIFDLICGTSTGGIIAILLGRLGLDCTTAISIYKELASKAFGGDEGKLWSRILKGEQFSSAAFETFLGEVVERYAGSQTTMMKIQKSNPDAIEHRTTDVFVMTAAAEADGARAYRLRSYVTPPWGKDSPPPDHNWTICQAALATSATPMYFAPLQIDSQPFQDAAASGFSNPTIEALREAELRWPLDTHEFVVISLGTGVASLLRNNRSNGEVATRLRARYGKGIAATTSFQQISELLWCVANDTEFIHRNADNYFSRKERGDYIRFDPPRGLGDLDLADHLSEGTIIESTNVWFRTPDGKELIWVAYGILKARKNERNNSTQSCNSLNSTIREYVNKWLLHKFR
ncbi:FabD/lysophospholipase-like protein [Imleria badia]|nr:FabD/lysophospholipase-like protein [Imleria badia]